MAERAGLSAVSPRPSLDAGSLDAGSLGSESLEKGVLGAELCCGVDSEVVESEIITSLGSCGAGSETRKEFPAITEGARLATLSLCARPLPPCSECTRRNGNRDAVSVHREKAPSKSAPRRRSGDLQRHTNTPTVRPKGADVCLALGTLLGVDLKSPIARLERYGRRLTQSEAAVKVGRSTQAV